jgi:hypothetical protein
MNVISLLLKAVFSLGRLPLAYRWIASAMASVIGRRIPDMFWVVGRRIQLSDAANIAYEEARYCRSIVAGAAERAASGKSRDAVLDYLATYIAKRSDIWGKRGSSPEIERIDSKQSNNGAFSAGASLLTLHGRGHTMFIDLQIDLADLEKIIRGLKTESKS